MPLLPLGQKNWILLILSNIFVIMNQLIRWILLYLDLAQYLMSALQVRLACMLNIVIVASTCALFLEC